MILNSQSRDATTSETSYLDICDYLIYIESIKCLLLLLSRFSQSCPTLCDPRDGSPPGSPVPGTLQARTLEWVAISFSSSWKWKVKGKSLSHVWLFETPWTAAPGSSIHGILQARVLDWVAIAFSNQMSILYQI